MTIKRSFSVFVFWAVSLFLLTVFSASAFNVDLTVSPEPDSSGGVMVGPASAPAASTVVITPVPPTPTPPIPVPPVPIPPPPIPPAPALPVVPTPSVPVPSAPAIPSATSIFSGVSSLPGKVATEVVNAAILLVAETEAFVNSPVGKIVTGVAEPLGIAAGIAIVVVQTILGTGMMTVSSLPDIYLLIWKLIGLMVGASKRRGKPWGTVYDAVTKRPLDPAYVVASRPTGEEVADAITDLDGRYGFLLSTGTYKLKASKTNYVFPTKTLENKTSDEIYDNIYHGEEIALKEGDVLIKNIPLDPIGFDWNEFAKNKQNLFRIYSERERFWNRIFDAIYLIGFLSAVIATIFDPRTVNFVFLAIYFLLILRNLFGKGGKKSTVVKYLATSMPIPYAVIKVFFAEVNNQVKTVIADHLGRFYFLVGPGRYYITVDEKQEDGTLKAIYKSEPMDLKNGYLSKDILV